MKKQMLVGILAAVAVPKAEREHEQHFRVFA